MQLYASNTPFRLPGHARQQCEANGDESDGDSEHAHPSNEGSPLSAILRRPPPLGSGRELQQRAKRILVLPRARPASFLCNVQRHLVLLPGTGRRLTRSVMAVPGLSRRGCGACLIHRFRIGPVTEEQLDHGQRRALVAGGHVERRLSILRARTVRVNARASAPRRVSGAVPGWAGSRVLHGTGAIRRQMCRGCSPPPRAVASIQDCRQHSRRHPPAVVIAILRRDLSLPLGAGQWWPWSTCAPGQSASAGGHQISFVCQGQVTCPL